MGLDFGSVIVLLFEVLCEVLVGDVDWLFVVMLEDGIEEIFYYSMCVFWL